MKKFCFVAGLPRSGSTLLCNILNQNPKFYASGTSPLPKIVDATKQAWSKSLDVQSQIDQEKDLYFNRFGHVLRGIIENWYKETDAEVIFDKSRPWNGQYLLLKKLYENPKMIVCVRDLRSVFASIERHSLDAIVYGNLLKPTLNNKMKEVFSAGGVIGNGLMYLLDLYERGLLSDLLVIRYEVLTHRPQETMNKVYDYLDEDPYDHDFDNVVRATHENDSVYRYNYPHRGEGKVTPCKPKDWLDVLPDKPAKIIREQHARFYKVFGYD